MKKTFALLIACLALGSLQASNPLWMRYCAISPDGSRIAFTYKGDIYVVPAQGGKAVQLTPSDAYDVSPVWSHDSQTLAYASDRSGNFDIWTIPADGGSPTRVTTHSANETPMAFSADDQEVLFTARIQKPALNAQFTSGWLTELYAVPCQGGRPRLITSATLRSLSLDSDGTSFVYENCKGSESEWRKHQVSSVARDLVYYNAKDGSHTLLTRNVGEDRNPCFLPGGRDIVFLSEREGQAQNVYRACLDQADQAKPLTHFAPYPVRFLTVSDQGLLCYGYQGEIYTQALDGEPVKVNIQLVDNKVYRPEYGQFDTPSSGDITPDGKQIVFASRGEIFVTSDEYATTRQITHTAEADDLPSFAPDGKTIVYQSERDGYYALYTASLPNPADRGFVYATAIEEKALFPQDGVERSCPKFSPDGKEVAYIEGRNLLCVLNLASGATRRITNGEQHYGIDCEPFEYQWSPNGEWFVITYTANRREPYTDIGLVKADGEGIVYPVTQSGYRAADPQWALDGQAVIFRSERYGMRSHASWGSQNDEFICFLNQEAYDRFRLSKEDLDRLKADEEAAKKAETEAKAEAKDSKAKKDKKDDKKEADKSAAKKVEVDTDRLMDRVIRLTPMSSAMNYALLSKDGEKLYFQTRFEKTMDLWEVDVRDRNIKKLKEGATGAMKMTSDGKTLFLMGSMQKVELASGKGTPIAYSSAMWLDRAAERKYMFDHVFLQEEKMMFLPDHNGADMPQIRRDFEVFLPHIDNLRDLAELLSEVLGELNVSHSGSRARIAAKSTDDATASLGLFYRSSYTGDGLCIDEILAGGPFDRKTSKVKAGDVVEKIDGVAIKAGEDFYPLLNRRSGVLTAVSLYSPASGKRWVESVKPISASEETELMYQRWIKHNAQQVDSLSGGRLGYVHIKSMGDPSFRDIYSDILGKYNLKDGVVIDTRFNGGGRLHEDVEVLFNGQKYFEQVIKGRISCEMPSRRYFKPSIMIQGEANYSNAHGTPWVYKHCGLGKLVGMPVPGTMSSVTWETLQDPEIYFGLPIVGYRLEDGSFLENQQLEPDIEVRNSVETLDLGRDLQLEAAVEALLKDVEGFHYW